MEDRSSREDVMPCTLRRGWEDPITKAARVSMFKESRAAVDEQREIQEGLDRGETQANNAKRGWEDPALVVTERGMF